MWGEAAVAGAAPFGFLLVLTRVAGLFVAVPLPGAWAVAAPARALFALALALSLAPLWPRVVPRGIGELALWLGTEAAFGLGVGLVLGFAAETLLFAAQSMALQAGFSYASMIDPGSQANSSVLQLLAQLTVNLLFFAAGLDHAALRAIARSLETFPPGSQWNGPAWLDAIQAGGTAMMDLGLRLALPVAGLLLLADLTLALASRLQAQLQLLSMAFPLKMLLALVSLAALAPVVVWAHRAGARVALASLRALGLG
jgi:flagellar biosynthetic protein FliR